MKRRDFIKNASLTGVGLTVGTSLLNCDENSSEKNKKDNIMASNNSLTPTAICTWGFVNANAKAGEELLKGTKALDAAIDGVAIE